MIELLQRAAGHAGRTAFRGKAGACSYAGLLERSAQLAGALLDGTGDLEEERIGMLLPAGETYTVAQWAIWRAGGIAVPLNREAARAELHHVLETAGVRRVLVAGTAPPALADAAEDCGARCVASEAMGDGGAGKALPDLSAARRALIVFTSGTTSKPKGVVTTHGMLAAQMRSLVEAWGWREDDSIPLFLPLHHVHGIVNVLGCALWSGACVEPFDGFRAEAVLERLRAGAYSVFMAVPTVYVRLIQALESMAPEEREACCAAFGRLRLMVSGSAALPESVYARWESLTGQRLLERYGMTEIGMALSNPLRGERRPGSVGVPLPGVELRLVGEDGGLIEGEDAAGEIQVRGPGVFREYWNNAAASAAAFSADGWFRTGDVALRERGYYRILGRQSVDIIKSGGYKISALEIESVLLNHPAIRECAVLGVADPTWGETVAAAVVLREDAALDQGALAAWCEDRMSPYKKPRRLLVLKSLPRNALGKVVKPELRKQFES